MSAVRIGLVVPNLTVETETPTLMLRHDTNFSFRSVHGAAEVVLADCDLVVVATASAEVAVGSGTPVVTIEEALIDALVELGARTVALVTSAASAATARVVQRLEHAGIEVVDAISLGIAADDAAALVDPGTIPPLVDRLALDGADAVVLAPCGRMPSLPVLDEVQRRTGRPVVSAVTAIVRAVLIELDLDPILPGGGAALAGPP